MSKLLGSRRGHNVCRNNAILTKVKALNTNNNTTYIYEIQPLISHLHLYFTNPCTLQGLSQYLPSSTNNNNTTVTIASKQHELAAIFIYVLETEFYKALFYGL